MAIYTYNESDSPQPTPDKEYIALEVKDVSKATNKKCIYKRFNENLGYKCYFPDLNLYYWVDVIKDVEEEKPTVPEMITVDHTNKHLVKVGDTCVYLDDDLYHNCYGMIREIDNDSICFSVELELSNTNPVTVEVTTIKNYKWASKIGIYKTEQQVKIEDIKESVKGLLTKAALTEKQINSIISKIK